MLLDLSAVSATMVFLLHRLEAQSYSGLPPSSMSTPNYADGGEEGIMPVTTHLSGGGGSELDTSCLTFT